MKLTIAKDQLLVGLQAVQNIVGSRSTLPILSNVLLEAGDRRLSLTATDLDVTITCSVNATVEVPGRATLPVKKLVDITRELMATDIEIEVDEKLSLIPLLRCRRTYHARSRLWPWPYTNKHHG